jgi:hypothetical protein
MDSAGAGSAAATGAAVRGVAQNTTLRRSVERLMAALPWQALC